ncbi:MAG: hypothetical protein QXN36_05325 [Candidatus Bathyarchaeia archaeon]
MLKVTPLWCFLLVLSLIPNHAHSASLSGKEGCIAYLQWCFVSELNFCFDAPTVAPKWVWITDNKIAYFSLLSYAPDIAYKIRNQLQNITETYNLPKDDCKLPITYKHDPIFGVPLPSHNGFNFSIQISLFNQSGYEIKHDIANSTEIINDWDEYADLCIYEALDQHLKGNDTKARQYVDRVISMWDGYGIADKIYQMNHHYETYKLGLLYIAKNILDYAILPFEDKLVTMVWRQQNASTGGIHTHYRRSGDKLWSEDLYSDTNVETTAFILWSNIPYNSTIEKPWYEDSRIVTPIIILVIVCIFVFKKYLWKRIRKCFLNNVNVWFHVLFESGNTKLNNYEKNYQNHYY